MMESEPQAFILSPEEDILSHGFVFYNLVKPRRDQENDTVMLESTNAMVNVVPRKRIYRMESLEELEIFQAELLRRPLVLQPLVKKGSGLQSLSCFFCLEEEKWAILINQTHPKVLGRILMGMDVAKMAIRSGEDFVLEYNFSDVVKRFYYTMMAQQEKGSFSYMDCEFGDLIIRYSSSLRVRGVKNQRRIQFNFEDIELEDLTVRRRELAEMERSNPRFTVSSQDELRDILPGWTFVDEMAEEQDYSYHNSHPREVNRRSSRSGRQRSRPNHSRYEVAVDLHAPGGAVEDGGRRSEETSFNDRDYLVDTASAAVYDTDVIPSNMKYIHGQQPSAGGRSSMADSGYQDDDLERNERNKVTRGYQGEPEFGYPVSVGQYPDKSRFGYENAAFNDDSDSDLERITSPHRSYTDRQTHSQDIQTAPVYHHGDKTHQRLSFDLGYGGTPVHHHGDDPSQQLDASYDPEPLSNSSMYFQTIEQMNAKATTQHRSHDPGTKQHRSHDPVTTQHISHVPVSESVLI